MPTNILSAFLMSWPSGKVRRYGLYLATFLMILIPRIILLGNVATVDEPAWILRSHNYIDAVKSGRFSETFFEHPGVTLMWVAGAAGKLAELSNKSVNFNSGKYQPNMRYILKIEQTAVAIVTSIFGWLACLWFAHALRSKLVLIFSSLLIGSDPFYVGLCRIVHLDGLMATFALASCGALVRFIVGDRSSMHSTVFKNYRWLAISGAMAGLSILSKTTGLILLPWALIVLVASRWIDIAGKLSNLWFALSRSVMWSIRIWTIWIVVIAAIVTVTWPALWVNPTKILSVLRAGTTWAQQQHPRDEVVLSHLDMISHYFIRFPIFIAPWIPWILIFCVVGFFFVRLISKKREAYDVLLDTTTRTSVDRHWLQVLLCLIVLVIIFPVGLGLFQRQAGRYILTSYISIDVFAAVVCVWITMRLTAYKPYILSFFIPLFLGLSIVCWITIAAWLPYAMAYRHPSWGNLKVHGKPLPHGWGEGSEIVAEKLNKLEDSDKLVVAARHYWILRIFFKGKSKNYKSVLDGSADFAILHKTFLEQYPNSKFMKTFRANHTLLDSIYVPQRGAEPIAWIFDARINHNSVY